MVKDILRSIEVQLLFFSFFSVGNEGRYDNSNLIRSIGKGVLETPRDISRLISSIIWLCVFYATRKSYTE